MFGPGTEYSIILWAFLVIKKKKKIKKKEESLNVAICRLALYFLFHSGYCIVDILQSVLNMLIYLWFLLA